MRLPIGIIQKIKKLHNFLFYLLILLLPTQLGKHFWPDWAMVSGLRVDYLSPTIYLTDILVFGILISWFVERCHSEAGGRRISWLVQARIRERLLRFARNDKKKTLYDILFFFIFIFLVFNSLFAQNQPAATYKLIKIIEFGLLGFYVAKNHFPLSTFRFRRNMSFPFSIAIIYSSLIAIFQFLNQASLGGLFWFLGERTFNAGTPGIAQAVWDGQLILRPYATFPHPNVLAGFLVVLLLIIFFSKPKLWWFTASLGMIALFLTFSRVAWAAFVLCVMCCELCERRKNIRHRTRSTILLGGTFFISTVIVIISLISLRWLPIQPESFAYRQDLNWVAIRTWQSSPFWGVGLNNFLVHLPEFYQFPGPVYFLQPAHNLFFMILAETGLIGLGLFLWFIAKTIRCLLLTTDYLLLTTLFAILFLGLFDHYFYTLQQGLLLFSLILGLVWAKPKMVK